MSKNQKLYMRHRKRERKRVREKFWLCAVILQENIKKREFFCMENNFSQCNNKKKSVAFMQEQEKERERDILGAGAK